MKWSPDEVRRSLPLSRDGHRVEFTFGEETYAGIFGLTLSGVSHAATAGTTEAVTVTITAPLDALAACGEALSCLLQGSEPLSPPLVATSIVLSYEPEGSVPSSQRLATMIDAVYRSLLEEYVRTIDEEQA